MAHEYPGPSTKDLVQTALRNSVPLIEQNSPPGKLFFADAVRISRLLANIDKAWTRKALLQVLSELECERWSNLARAAPLVCALDESCDDNARQVAREWRVHYFSDELEAFEAHAWRFPFPGT